MSTSPVQLSAAEFRRREEAVRGATRTRGLDAVAVTYQLHAEWLTGTWGSQFWVAPAVVPVDADAAFLVRLYDEDRVRLEGRIGRLETYFDRDDAIEAWAQLLRDMGLHRSRLGLELDNLDLTHRDVTELCRLLPDLTVVDVSDLVPRLMAVKSEEEVAVMRVAADRTRLALEAFRDGLVPGVTELGLRGQMEAAVRAAGSEELRGGVAFGKHSAVPHGEDGDTVLQTDDPAYTECSGYHLGYCATTCRSAVVGRSPVAERVYDTARRTVDAIEAALRPGVTAGSVDAAARRVVEDAGFGSSFRHRTGYSVGLRANGRLNISLKPGAQDVIEPGMTFHTPIILFVPDECGMACSETFLVTESGAEPLVGTGRELIRV